jgi:uncharacterized protein YbjQ (UPF0145 family)
VTGCQSPFDPVTNEEKTIMSDRYSVIFEGRLIAGKDEGMVKARIKSALKTDDQGIARLFSGIPVAVRKSTDLATAEKYKQVFADAGALCEIRKEGEAEAGVSGSATGPGDPPAGPPAPPADHVSVQPMTTSDGGKMIITNIETVPGKTMVEHFGLVSGSTIRAKHIGRDLMASLKNLVGGELKGYTQLLQESRTQAVDRMVAEARLMGANAIVNVRFSTSSVAQGAAELYAYGTAVRVE